MTCTHFRAIAFYMASASALAGCGTANVIGTSSSPTDVTRPTVTLTVDNASVSTGAAATLSWSSTQSASCSASGGWTGDVGTSGTQTVKPSKTTTYTLTCTGGGESASASTTVSVTGLPNAVARPDYNTGDGFFVLNGKLYDPDGIEFRMRGVDRNHYDSQSEAGIVKSGANSVRVFVGTSYGKSWAGLGSIIQNEHINHQQLAIPATDLSSGRVKITCSPSTSALTAAVNDWVASASTWTPLGRYTIINIANEWGPSNSTTWRDAYIAAVQKMRATGYTAPLMIDSGGCGQDKADLLTYADDVFNADPQKNIVFSFHLYGQTKTADMAPFFAQLDALQQSAGMVFVIGEFGPGRNIGPSPTTTTPGQVITAAEDNNLGWLAWAWDDNNLGNCRANDSWFSMTTNCGHYAQDSDLTIFGKDVVLNSTYGLQKLAQKPNW